MADRFDLDAALRDFKLIPRFVRSWYSYRWTKEEVRWLKRQLRKARRG